MKLFLPSPRRVGRHNPTALASRSDPRPASLRSISSPRRTCSASSRARVGSVAIIQPLSRRDPILALPASLRSISSPRRTCSAIYCTQRGRPAPAMLPSLAEQVRRGIAPKECRVGRHNPTALASRPDPRPASLRSISSPRRTCSAIYCTQRGDPAPAMLPSPAEQVRLGIAPKKGGMR